jgi:DNA polymerase-3 subunit alpha
MGKKDRDLMAQQREKFIERCLERKVAKAKAEKVWDLMAPFAGYAFNKSHAAAYAVVAYQTAYAKANFPVEFMAALLTSEMGDTDKIVKYIEECRAMGIQIQPPDVNVSSVRFSVAGETVRFGLAAIKNVGEAAIETILVTRGERGPFRSLTDFCGRVDLRLVNRRVIESLVKAGAFDSLGLTRAHLLASLDAAMETGQREQRDRDEGQVSLFDLGTPATGAPAEVPVLAEWDADQRLAYEKDVLGFYVSGHPLARFRPLVESLGVTQTADLGAKGSGARVTLCGQVTTMKEIPTKSGDRMAFVTLEDMDGTVELTVFPAVFRGASTLLRGRDPILVKGRVDDTDKGRVVLAEEIRPLEQALDGAAMEPRAPQCCRLIVRDVQRVEALLPELRAVAGEHSGVVPLFVHLWLPGLEVVVRAREVPVDASPALVAKLETLVGAGGVLVEYAGRA